MNSVLKIMLGAAFIGLAACGSSKTESMSDTDSIVVSSDTATVDDEAAIDDQNNSTFSQMELTARHVFALVLPVGLNSDDFEDIVIAECTPAFINALKQANDFDDGGIAWWALRTMEQEGPGETEIFSITPDGKDAVIVSYSDMGHKATTRLEFVKDGEKYKVNSAVVTFKGEKRTIK